MTTPDRPKRSCPKCQSASYLFRARKTIDAPEDEGGKQVETKYRCRACSHDWKERVPAPPDPKSADEAA